MIIFFKKKMKPTIEEIIIIKFILEKYRINLTDWMHKGLKMEERKALVSFILQYDIYDKKDI